MPTTDPRIDAYIEGAADFARPILTHFRDLVHKACPDVTETIKWQMPFFDYKGKSLCYIAGFKAHCRCGFWSARMMKIDPETKEALERLTTVKEFPPTRTMLALIKDAALINELAVAAPKKKAAPAKAASVKGAVATSASAKGAPTKGASAKASIELPVPAALAAALKRYPAAGNAFKEFSPSHRKEYIEWITEAKTDATREKRIATTIEWLTEGKSRNWKYRK